MLKEKRNCQPEILDPATLSFKSAGKIKIFPDKQNVQEHINPWIFPAKNVQDCPARWNESTLESNTKPNEEIKIENIFFWSQWNNARNHSKS